MRFGADLDDVCVDDDLPDPLGKSDAVVAVKHPVAVTDLHHVDGRERAQFGSGRLEPRPSGAPIGGLVTDCRKKVPAARTRLGRRRTDDSGDGDRVDASPAPTLAARMLMHPLKARERASTPPRVDGCQQSEERLEHSIGRLPSG